MLLVLLVTSLALANSEWVEISQQHYRKPVRGPPYPVEEHHPSDETHLYPQNEVLSGNNQEHMPVHIYHPSEVETQVDPTKGLSYPKQNIRNPELAISHEDHETIRPVRPKGNRIYLNHSLSEHTWTQNTVAFDHPGNIKHIKAADFKVQPNITPEFSLEIYGTVTENPELVIRNILKEPERVSATIERVSNTGSIRRVQLSNTPVKAPIEQKPMSPKRRSGIRNHDSDSVDGFLTDEINIQSDIFLNKKEEVINTSPANMIQYDFSTKETSVSNFDRIIIPSTVSMREPAVPYHKYSAANSHNQKDKQQNDNESYRTNSKNVSSMNEKRITDKIQTGFQNVNKLSSVEKAPNLINNKYKEPEPDIDIEKVTITDEGKVKAKQNLPSNVNFKNTKDRYWPYSDSNTSGEDNKSTEKLKITMENVMKFMKVVADTISKNTRRGVNGKVMYLNELKDTLLNSIKARIDGAWPDDTSNSARRRSRSAPEAARGHVEFPSSESALMTISFLTFAVFLIKLVLQVIQTYKNKTMMMAPLVVATAGRAVRKLRTTP